MFVCRKCKCQFQDHQISDFNNQNNKICKKCDGWPDYIECMECDANIPVMEFRSDLSKEKQVMACNDCYSKHF